MKKLFAAIFLGFILAPLFSENEKELVKENTPLENGSAQKDEIQKASQFRKDLLFRMNDILSEIERNYPSFVGKFSKADEEKTIKGLIASLNSGIEYLPADAQEVKDAPREEKKETKIFPAIIMASQKALYVRIDVFNEKSSAALKEECESASRLVNKPVGVVIDLRDCQGFDYDSCIRALSLFCPPSKVPAKEEMLLPGKILNTPVVIITGNKTKGVAEIFADVMLENGQCLVIGGSTSGNPFIKKKIPLKSGSSLLIPEIPDFLANIRPLPVQPTINTMAYPQVPYEKLSKSAGSEDADNCLQRSLDLLVSLDALHKEQGRKLNEKVKVK